MSQPIDTLLINCIKGYMRRHSLKSEFLADEIMLRQIKDIPEPGQRVHFDETGSDTALANNGKRLRRWLNQEVQIPFRIFPSIFKVVGCIDVIKRINLEAGGFYTEAPSLETMERMGPYEHLSKCLKEQTEANEVFRLAYSDGDIQPEELTGLQKEMSDAQAAIEQFKQWAIEQARGQS